MSLERPPLFQKNPTSLSLLPSTAGQTGGSFDSSRSVLIGSNSSCELRSDHIGLSKRHALLVCQADGRWWVYDLHSRRGVKVNRRRVLHRRLADGDTLDLGGSIWRVKLITLDEKAATAMAAANPLQDFTNLKLLHRGENGALYRADWQRKQRVVALRLFSRDFGKGKSTVRRLKELLPRVAAVHHENIVRLYRGGRYLDEDGSRRWFLASEYMVGGSLRDRLAKRADPLPLSDVAALARDIAKGLMAVEALGRRHRNISPSSLLFDAEGQAKLGELLHSWPEAERPRSEIAKHELAYRPPEHVRGESELKPSADLYSLAACLYEGLTLRPPFAIEGRSVVELVQAIREERLASPREFNPGVSKEFADLIMNSLAQNPDKRPENAQEFLKRLEKATRTPDKA